MVKTSTHSALLRAKRIIPGQHIVLGIYIESADGRRMMSSLSSRQMERGSSVLMRRFPRGDYQSGSWRGFCLTQRMEWGTHSRERGKRSATTHAFWNGRRQGRGPNSWSCIALADWRHCCKDEIVSGRAAVPAPGAARWRRYRRRGRRCGK